MGHSGISYYWFNYFSQIQSQNYNILTASSPHCSKCKLDSVQFFKLINDLAGIIAIHKNVLFFFSDQHWEFKLLYHFHFIETV